MTATISIAAPATIPQSHRDLLTRPVHGVLSSMMPKCQGSHSYGQGSHSYGSEAQSQPQSSLVWVDYDGIYVLINTTMERQKGRNMQANPKVSLLVVDPTDTTRWIEVRGRVADITTDGAIPHADKLTQRYTGKQHFYGDIYEVAQRQRETRVIVKIMPVKVSLDAIFR